VTPAHHRLAATAACLVGPRAASLLARGPSPEASAEAASLAALPREERLRTLAVALESASLEERCARAREFARPERRRVAALVTRVGRGEKPGPGVAPTLVRIVRERLAR
jgi:hypothetical protein